MKHFSLRLVMCATILALMMTACSSAVESTATFPTPQQPTQTPIPTSAGPTPTTMPNGLVDVGGRKLMFHCTGQGGPTVILEAGGPDDSSVWIKVQSGGDPTYRVCSYDRANLGMSDEAQKPRTFLDMTRDLHILLVNAHIEGPYILVGHSMGGMLVRLYAAQYPGEVAGLVLVDSAHPEMGTRLLAGLPSESIFESKAIRTWRQYLTGLSNSNGREQRNPEGVNLQVSNEQVKASQPPSDLPLVVISRSPSNSDWPSMPTLPTETNAALFQIWQDLQNELAGLSSNSTHIAATHAGHMIPTEEPELIIEAIRKLVNDARSRMGATILPALPGDQTDPAHTPRILRVVEWQERQNGHLVIHNDIQFTDDAGDAVFVRGTLISADPPGDWSFSPDGFVTVSADDQKNEGVIPNSISCGPQATFVFQKWIVDQAGNVSEPVTYTYSCLAPQRSVSPLLIIGLVTGLGLLAVAAWLLLRYRRARRAATSLA